MAPEIEGRTVRKLKIVTIIAIMLCSLYPIAELTRAIIQYMIIDSLGTEPLHLYYTELAMMWSFYLCIPFILNKVFNLITKGKEV